MAEENRSKRRSRGARGVVRRDQTIDQVKVHEPFQLHEPLEVASSSDRRVGDGCYVSATVNNRRFYGVLVDQEALKTASLLHFQDEANGLDLNRRMKFLKQNNAENAADSLAGDDLDGKRPATDDLSPNRQQKRARMESSSPGVLEGVRQVEKFRYVQPEATNGNSIGHQGYRLLLATYADVMAAAEDDPAKASPIEEACRSGGGFVGNYYYQYEVKNLALEVGNSRAVLPHQMGMRMSMGFHSFLNSTALPPWFPLSNLQVGQQKLLSMLSMKKDNNGNVIWDHEKDESETSVSVRTNLLPMKPRSRFRVVVIGGGIAGISACSEIFKECKKDRIPVEVVLLEGRDRLGGRLCTDRATFKAEDGVTPFPVDLGASWIHGIDHNPLAALAKEAGVDFVASSESVKMFQEDMKVVDPVKDENAGELFDKLLDLASEDIWKVNTSLNEVEAKQAAVRWYASQLNGSDRPSKPVASVSNRHRRSTDISVDCAVGRAIASHKLSEFSRLSSEERRMLLWNLKNVEYALGANVSDLSMKFWDIDERHAFEGDHVILRQGYSSVIDHMVKDLEQHGSSFDIKLNFGVAKVQYARKTTTRPPLGGSRGKQAIPLSDTCCVTSQDGSKSIPCDFVVCCVPLGVLKDSVSEDGRDDKIVFDPPLPFSKRDAIESVGFGLLNKVYLQFPQPFWRSSSIMDDDQTLFGNASETNPHHYMFFDIGKSLGSQGNNPPILMSLVSGREAVKCEGMTESQLVEEALATLRAIFSPALVPDPIAYKTTRWGTDRFSRGSYTFLPPGTTDQDFQLLQSPINGNGDSLILEGSETMRLFWAGEHTSALHPSMAHGALLSGVRAAKEVLAAMSLPFGEDEGIDRLIPMALYRHMFPDSPASCSMCHRSGTTIREGTLLAFKKGSRHVLVHNCCAENSPEVEVFEGKWKNVIKAVSRSRTIECFLCGRTGASIGCTHEDCHHCFHYCCAEDTGWRFDKDGKEFFCSLHRVAVKTDCVRISVDFYRSQRGSGPSVMACCLCGNSDSNAKTGQLLAFQRGEDMVVIHVNCARFTSIVDMGEDSSSRLDHEYRNVFVAIERATTCARCKKRGATVSCSEESCDLHFHVPCAEATGWRFEKQPKFRCLQHRVNQAKPSKPPADKTPPSKHNEEPGSLFQHSLFSHFGAKANPDVPGNLDIQRKPVERFPSPEKASGLDDSSSDSEDAVEEDNKVEAFDKGRAGMNSEIKIDSYELIVKEPSAEIHLVRLHRNSLDDLWNVDFFATRFEGDNGRALLSVATARADPFDNIENGDIVLAINGRKVGSPGFNSLEKVLSRLGQEVEAMMEVERA